MSRKKEEEESHDKAVIDISKERFSFPNSSHPDWKTFTNPNGEQNKGIKKNQETAYPDIVVVDTGKNVAVMIGEVETESTVNDAETEQWKEYSSLCSTFYLYVPEGYGAEAKRILDSKKIAYSGVRTYAYNSKGDIVITNI
ncbi:MAG: hypothetical protein NWE95_01785 [Candidatus Bathyarchaeota archaeon]|nr:hypothetical protein [Candidatus Bathyarchaeota archaeon]